MLTINDLAQSKLRSSSLDKLHGQKKAIELCYSGDEVYHVSDDARTEEIRQRLEKATGKAVYVIDKGSSFVDEFFDSISESNPTEVIDIDDEFEEIKFTDFSLYHVKGYTYSPVFMDAREIILPPKSTVERGIKRLYIVKLDGNLYKLPELEYPKIIVQFLKWAKKKKKLAINSIDEIWNYEKKIVFFKAGDSLGRDGAIDWYETGDGYWGNQFFCNGYPVKNLKTEDDLVNYNDWLQSDYKSIIDASNKIYKKCWQADKRTPGGARYHDSFWTGRIKTVPYKLDPTEITTITQADVDQFINEWNNKYQVKR